MGSGATNAGKSCGLDNASCRGVGMGTLLRGGGVRNEAYAGGEEDKTSKSVRGSGDGSLFNAQKISCASISLRPSSAMALAKGAELRIKTNLSNKPSVCRERKKVA